MEFADEVPEFVEEVEVEDDGGDVLTPSRPRPNEYDEVEQEQEDSVEDSPVVVRKRREERFVSVFLLACTLLHVFMKLASFDFSWSI